MSQLPDSYLKPVEAKDIGVGHVLHLGSISKKKDLPNCLAKGVNHQCNKMDSQGSNHPVIVLKVNDEQHPGDVAKIQFVTVFLFVTSLIDLLMSSSLPLLAGVCLYRLQ